MAARIATLICLASSPHRAPLLCCLHPLQLMVPVFWGKKSHVPWDKQVQGHTAKRKVVQPLQPGSSRPNKWSSMQEAGWRNALAVYQWLEGT